MTSTTVGLQSVQLRSTSMMESNSHSNPRLDTDHLQQHAIFHAPRNPARPTKSVTTALFPPDSSVLTPTSGSSVHMRSGWLQKKSSGSAGPLAKVWKKNWFVLREKQLVYYKDEKEYKPKNIIEVPDMMSVAMLTGSGAGHFAVFTKKRTYHLRAGSAHDAELWVAALRSAIEKDEENDAGYRQDVDCEDEAADGLDTKMSNLTVTSSATSELASASSAPRKPSLNHSFSASSSLHPNPGFLSASARMPSYQVYSGDDEELAPLSSSCGSDSAVSPLGRASSDFNGSSTTSSGISKAGVRQKQIRQTSITSISPAASGEPAHELYRGPLLRLKKRYKHWAAQTVVLDTRALYISKASSTSGSTANSTTTTQSPPQKRIPVHSILDVIELDALSKSKLFCFQVITADKRLRFCAPSEDELVRWLAAFRQVLDDRSLDDDD